MLTSKSTVSTLFLPKPRCISIPKGPNVTLTLWAELSSVAGIWKLYCWQTHTCRNLSSRRLAPRSVCHTLNNCGSEQFPPTFSARQEPKDYLFFCLRGMYAKTNVAKFDKPVDKRTLCAEFPTHFTGETVTVPSNHFQPSIHQKSGLRMPEHTDVCWPLSNTLQQKIRWRTSRYFNMFFEDISVCAWAYSTFSDIVFWSKVKQMETHFRHHHLNLSPRSTHWKGPAVANGVGFSDMLALYLHRPFDSMHPTCSSIAPFAHVCALGWHVTLCADMPQVERAVQGPELT